MFIAFTVHQDGIDSTDEYVVNADHAVLHHRIGLAFDFDGMTETFTIQLTPGGEPLALTAKEYQRIAALLMTSR